MSIRTLAIIPARGGSKGIPKKNLRLLDNRPLISYPIIEAKKSKKLSRLVVSTDDFEIKAVAESFGVDVVIRPAEISLDKSPVIDTVIQVIKFYKEKGEYFDVVILLQPTSPFWSSYQLDEIISIFDDLIVDGVISVIPSVEAHPSRMYSLTDSEFLVPIMVEGETHRRQELEPVFFRNGCFYAVRTPVIFSQKTLMPQRKKAYIMDPEWFLTIDTPRDLKLAEIMAQEWNSIHR